MNFTPAPIEAMALPPFALSLSKRSVNQGGDFDKLSPNGVKLSPNGNELSPNGQVAR